VRSRKEEGNGKDVQKKNPAKAATQEGQGEPRRSASSQKEEGGVNSRPKETSPKKARDTKTTERGKRIFVYAFWGQRKRTEETTARRRHRTAVKKAGMSCSQQHVREPSEGQEPGRLGPSTIRSYSQGEEIPCQNKSRPEKEKNQPQTTGETTTHLQGFLSRKEDSREGEEG